MISSTITTNSFLSKVLNAKFSVRCTFLDYAGVLAAIPKAWKNEITSNIVCGVSELSKAVSNSDDIVSTKKARLMLTERSFSPPIVEISSAKKSSVKLMRTLRP